MIPGKLEITLKIAELPNDAQTVHGRVHFTVAAGNCVVRVALKAKAYRHITDAAAKWPGSWGAAITGKLDEAAPGQLALVECGVTAYEKKPRSGASAVAPSPPASLRTPREATLAEAYRRTHPRQIVVEYRRPRGEQ